ncbi:MAG: hypothetical protein HYU99_08945 [Deltaproteobacteria bacterium]|nr:hypothetical protein [Deltaproteobacteria bacterium]
MKITHAPIDAKKMELERLLKNGTVMVLLDSRRFGVQAPQDHMGNPQLALNFDTMFNIPDFKILDDRIEATLEFGPMNFFCVIPFDAVYGYRPLSGDEAVVFPESVPKDLVPPPTKSPLPPLSQTCPPVVWRRGERGDFSPAPPPLAVVKSPDPAEKKEEPKPAKKKGHLKLVK